MILVLRAFGLGDFLTSVPALRAVRRAHPDAELTLAAPAGLAPVVSRMSHGTQQRPVVDHIIDVHATSAAPLRWRGPAVDLAVNMHGTGRKSTWLLSELSHDRLWSYGLTDAPEWDPYEHEVDRWRRLVEAYGCPTRSDDLFLGPPGHRDGPVLIHPSARWPDRRWPTDRYAEVARAVAERKLPVRITAGPGEEDLAREVATAAGLPPETVLDGLDLGELTEYVQASRLVICGDTGIAHLATAYHTPSVVLFGPVSPAQWGPPAGGPHRVLWCPLPGDKSVRTGEEPHPALLRIDPDDVLAAAGDLLAR